MWRRARAVLRFSYGGEYWSSWAVFPEQLQLIPMTLDQSAKAWFYSEKWLCKNGTFLLSRSGRCVLSKLHLLTLVTKISFLRLSCSVSTAEWRELWKQKLDPVPHCRTNYYKSQPAAGLHWHHSALHSFSVGASGEEHGRKESKLILLIEF